MFLLHPGRKPFQKKFQKIQLDFRIFINVHRAALIENLSSSVVLGYLFLIRLGERTQQQHKDKCSGRRAAKPFLWKRLASTGPGLL